MGWPTTEPKATTPCNVVGEGCLAPPGLAFSHTKAECYACGLPVCTKCSTRRDYATYGRQRICRNCGVELERTRKDNIVKNLKKLQIKMPIQEVAEALESFLQVYGCDHRVYPFVAGTAIRYKVVWQTDNDRDYFRAFSSPEMAAHEFITRIKNGTVMVAETPGLKPKIARKR